MINPVLQNSRYKHTVGFVFLVALKRDTARLSLAKKGGLIMEPSFKELSDMFIAEDDATHEHYKDDDLEFGYWDDEFDPDEEDEFEN